MQNPAVGIEDVLHNGQPEPGAFGTLIEPGTAGQGSRAQLFSNSGPVVLDSDARALQRYRCGDLHPRLGMPGRIFQTDYP